MIEEPNKKNKKSSKSAKSKPEENKEELKEKEEKKEEPAVTEDEKKPRKEEKEECKTNIKYEELNDKYLRVLAEYDNFRRRTGEERDGIFSEAYKEAITELLPVIDSLEKAAEIASERDKDDKLAEGISLVLSQWKTARDKLGIEEIESATGTKFDPEVHNAVMHVEDDSLGENEIAETFQKGYIHGGKVIRFAMVKVAN